VQKVVLLISMLVKVLNLATSGTAAVNAVANSFAPSWVAFAAAQRQFYFAERPTLLVTGRRSVELASFLHERGL
jgi:hypothetical protein